MKPFTHAGRIHNKQKPDSRPSDQPKEQSTTTGKPYTTQLTAYKKDPIQNQEKQKTNRNAEILTPAKKLTDPPTGPKPPYSLLYSIQYSCKH